MTAKDIPIQIKISRQRLNFFTVFCNISWATLISTSTKLFLRYSWPKRQGLPDSIFKSSYNTKLPTQIPIFIYPTYMTPIVHQKWTKVTPAIYLLVSCWICRAKMVGCCCHESLVNPGLRARMYHLMSTIPLFLLYFFGFAAKVISGSDIEMFMRWSHQWMRPINKGSPFGQMCQFPFPYCYIAPFSSFAFSLSSRIGKVQIKSISWTIIWYPWSIAVHIDPSLQMLCTQMIGPFMSRSVLIRWMKAVIQTNRSRQHFFTITQKCCIYD